MTSRELVLGILAHKRMSRHAIDLGATDCSSIHAIAYNRLKKHLDIDPRPTHVTDMTQLIALTDPKLQDRFLSDVITLDFEPGAFKPYQLSDGSSCLIPDGFNYETSPEGDQVVRSPDGRIIAHMPREGLYFEPEDHALADLVSPRQVDRHLDCLVHADEPACLDEPLDVMERRAAKLYESTQRAVVFQLRFHIMQAAQILRGYENYMMDLVLRPALVEAIHEVLTEVYIERGLRLLDRFGKYCDCIFLCDDLGTQNGPMLSPEMYRRMLKPYQARMVAALKGHSGHPLLFHSCGSVYKLIPDLIEIGVDALNPVQVSAADMDSAKLVGEFGNDIVFWGGGCDTQQVLGRATSAQVADEVTKRLRDFSRAPGYVFCAVHNIQPNVSPESIVTLYDTANSHVTRT